ncbi:restriction endonuclease subunit S [Acinetobacter sp. USHLN143]|uniref:restriction endonuclease subunit S n=1 Tax=Acinetobacter sp. USHLN143 TaxID=3081679 RepID=UPI003018068A
MESNTILYKPLGDVIELLTDYHANGAYEKLKENVTLLDKENHAVMIRTTNFEANDFTNNLIYIDEHAYEFLKKSKVYASDLIMNKIANPGTVYFMPEISKPVSLGMNLFLIRVNPKKANPYFIYAYLRKNEHYVKSFASGSTTKTITKDDVRRLKIFMPPLQEQNKIAQILSTWDQAISATEKMLENSQQQKKALMQQLLTGKKRLFDENGVRFVGEWEKVHIKDCAECLDNKRVPLNSEQRSSMSGTIPYWGANGIVDYISDFIFDETIVLLAEDGGYFDEYQTRPISNISYGKCWVNNHAHILRAKKNSLNEWIYYCLVHKNILAFVNGGTRAKLNKSDMLMIPLLLPSLQEQKKIVSVLSLADQEIENLQKKLDCLKQEKKALMQQLLTGKKRVKVAA